MRRYIIFPTGSLIVLSGPSGSGKTTFVDELFHEEEIINSDKCRRIICGDAGNQAVSGEAFSLLYEYVQDRLSRGETVVVDSVALDWWARSQLMHLAWRNHAYSVLFLFDVPLDLCIMRDQDRDRHVGEDVITRQQRIFLYGLPALRYEGFDQVLTVKESGPEFEIIPGVEVAGKAVPGLDDLL